MSLSWAEAPEAFDAALSRNERSVTRPTIFIIHPIRAPSPLMVLDQGFLVRHVERSPRSADFFLDLQPLRAIVKDDR